MMRHVLAHNGGREAGIVHHLAQLVRPSGTVYLVDGDGAAVRTRNLDPDLADLNTKYAELHARRGNDVQVGLRLDELLEAAGLEVVAYRGWYLIFAPPPQLRPPARAARDEMALVSFLWVPPAVPRSLRGTAPPGSVAGRPGPALHNARHPRRHQ